MRIAQVAPLYESVPPQRYGGIERVVAYLTDTLVGMGHEVTLFATGDSRTRGTLVPFHDRAIRLDASIRDPVAPHLHMLEEVYRRADEFDVIHFHVDHLHLSMMRRLGTPWLSTMHNRLDLPEIQPLYAAFPDAPLVSISHAQRRLAGAGWLGNVYHGLPPEDYPWRAEKGDYLAFVGRIEPDKGVHEALKIARLTGMPLRMAGKLEAHNMDFYHKVVVPAMVKGEVEYLGEVDEATKRALMRDALVVLFPIRWPEPFGLVMIEAMAGGTPVIAYRAGAAPEVVDDGLTGFIVDDAAAAAALVPEAERLERRRIRARFEERFSAERMTRDYLALYERLIAAGPVARARPRATVPGHTLVAAGAASAAVINGGQGRA